MTIWVADNIIALLSQSAVLLAGLWILRAGWIDRDEHFMPHFILESDRKLQLVFIFARQIVFSLIGLWLVLDSTCALLESA